MVGSRPGPKPSQGVRWDAGTRDPEPTAQGSHAMSFATTNESLAFEECPDASLAESPTGCDAARSAVSGVSLQFQSYATLGEQTEPPTARRERIGGGAESSDILDASEGDIPHAYRSARLRAAEEDGGDSSSNEGLEEALRESLTFQSFLSGGRESVAFKTYAGTQASLLFRSAPDTRIGDGTFVAQGEEEEEEQLPTARQQKPEEGNGPPLAAATPAVPDDGIMLVQQKDGKGLVRFLAVGESSKQQIMYIPDGTSVRVLCQQYNWAQVEHEGLVGVVKRKDLGLTQLSPESRSRSGSGRSPRSGRAARQSASPSGPAQAGRKAGPAWRPGGGSTNQLAEPPLSARSHRDPTAKKAVAKPPVEKRSFYQPRKIDIMRTSMREEEQKRKSSSKSGSKAAWVPAGEVKTAIHDP